MRDQYDFIVIGGKKPPVYPIQQQTPYYCALKSLTHPRKGGTAGPLLASRLAHAATKPSILLLEAGGDNKHLGPQAPADRYITSTRPELDHAYVTTPQAALRGRQLAYPRGRGLGGSSVVNFMVWNVGAQVDYERWAEEVGDEAWKWERVKERLKRVGN